MILGAISNSNEHLMLADMQPALHTIPFPLKTVSAAKSWIHPGQRGLAGLFPIEDKEASSPDLTNQA
jgi:hypothetical protein